MVEPGDAGSTAAPSTRRRSRDDGARRRNVTLRWHSVDVTVETGHDPPHELVDETFGDDRHIRPATGSPYMWIT